MSTVLVVDDKPFCRTLVTKTLGFFGYEAVEATSAKEALKVLSSRKIDLMILEIEMPEVSGLTLLRQLREGEQWRKLPVIMLTSTADREAVLEARQLGATEYLLKSSFNVHTIVERVKHCLGADAPAGSPGEKAAPSTPTPAPAEAEKKEPSPPPSDAAESKETSVQPADNAQ